MDLVRRNHILLLLQVAMIILGRTLVVLKTMDLQTTLLWVLQDANSLSTIYQFSIEIIT